jgi:CDP-diacylglycerol--glycerol-3-phosphate 3-phosphatidyltransferase
MDRIMTSSSHVGRDDTAADRSAPPVSDRTLTIPNVLCGVRLILSPGLIVLALLQQPYWFLALYVFLAMTDWLDGKLAILLNQRSVLGARLDSAADVTLYGSLLLGGLWLTWHVLRHESLWIALVIVSYVLSTAAGWWKFGRLPAYHTRAAKTSWLLVLIAAVCVFANQWVWMIRVSLVAVTLTNLEALLITGVLAESRTDIPSLWHALRLRQCRRHNDVNSQSTGTASGT